MESKFPKFLEDRGVSISCKWDDTLVKPEDFKNSDSWKCTLKYKGHRLTVPFFQGYGHNGEEPTAAGVLHCLISDTSCGEQSFEELCSEFGYDTDSRKHHKTWKACVSIAKKLHKFLGEDFDVFEEAAQDY
jgi:hypothetical protein